MARSSKRKVVVKLPSRTIEECVARIKDDVIRQFTAKALRQAPKYFWTASSSSSRLHHPPDEHGIGGLVLHTVRVFNLSEIFLDSFDNGSIRPDVVKSAALLHDLYRYGVSDVAEDTTNKKHPELAAKALLGSDFHFIYKAEIIHCVERHMGKWGDVLPNTVEEWVVHFSDAVAAKYYLPHRANDDQIP